MSPNTRKSKFRNHSGVHSGVTKYIQEFDLSKVDQAEVSTLSLKQLGIYDQIKFTRKPRKAGRLLTSMEARHSVWNY